MSIKRNLIKKLAIVLILVVAVVGVLGLGRHYFWWFTPAYKDKSVTNAFIADLTQGNDQTAYNLTASQFQSNTSLKSFEEGMYSLVGSNPKISSEAYTVNNGDVSIGGVMSDQSVGHQMAFSFLFLAKTHTISSVLFRAIQS